nr:hypothetical protein [Methylomagnum ishizawai]
MGTAFAFDEVGADLMAFRVALHHGDVLGGFEGELVIDRWAAPEGVFARFGENLHVVLIGNETAIFEAFLDPVGKVAGHAEEGVKIAGIDELDGLPVEFAGENRHEIGAVHDDTFMNEFGTPPRTTPNVRRWD